MKTKIVFFCAFLLLLLTFNPSLAEDKSATGGVIPKLPQTANDPELFNGQVYPEWGPVCQRYTYAVTYRDKEGRPPEYVQIYFNGEMIEMSKSDPAASDYRKGVRYEYQYVPHKLGSNFYYFEASNGLGKARDSIIDSPDNGPVLFESVFDQNEVVLIEAATGTVAWRFSTGKEWVGGVVLSDDGRYLAALTSQHVYFFSTASDQPLWQYEFNQSSPIGGGPRGNGIAISDSGSKVIASVGMKTILFGSQNSQPIWEYPSPSLTVSISADGQSAAAGSVRQGRGEAVNVLLLWQTENPKPVWEFSSDSNFHDVSLSADGQYLAASTGCPDRKGYIFSKESPQPLVQSERLTFDSPVSKSKISADGRLAAFATEGGPDSNVVVLFSKDSQTPLWRFDNQKRNSSRAMKMTADGQLIAAATMKGDVYLLSSKSNTPLKSWSLNASVGALDLAEDGRFLALGGTDKLVHLLPQDGEAQEIAVNEFIQAIDISGDGRFVAVGTGGSVYFFEDYLTSSKDKIFECEEIIEPPPQETGINGYGFGETTGGRKFLPIFGGGFLLVIFGLLAYYLGVRWRFSTRKRVFFLLLTFSLLAVAFVVYQSAFSLLRPEAPPTDTTQTTGEAVCGNNLCEPDWGETKESCPQDCSAGD